MRRLYGIARRNSLGGAFGVFILFAALFLVGVTGGAFMASGAAEEEMAEFAGNVSYWAEHSGNSNMETTVKSFLSISGTLLFIWLSGFLHKIPCALISGAVVLYKGTVTGYTVGMLSRTYALKGVLLAAVGILPQYIILLPLMFLLSTAAFSFDLHPPVQPAAVKKYLAFLGVALVFSALAALSDGFVSGKLMHMFF